LGFLPLALAGSLWLLAAWVRRRFRLPELEPDRVRLLIALWAWFYAASIALFFVTDRYRVPIVPCLVLLAAVAIEMLIGWSRVAERRWLPVVLATLLAAFFVTSPARIGVDLKAMQRDLQVHAGLRAAAAERWDNALAHYDRAHQIDPLDADVVEGKARLLARAGRDREAITAFRTLLATHPDDARAWYNLGNAHRRAGRDSIALAAYQKSLALEPEREAAWNQLGEAYRALGDTARAADAYRSALALAPAYEVALNNLAALRAQQGQPGAAEAGFRAALAANPRYLPALVNLAILVGPAPEARELWRRVLAMDPQNELAHEMLREVDAQPPARPGGAKGDDS
jgi:tetratricopeptide (TPR) repeat protein